MPPMEMLTCGRFFPTKERISSMVSRTSWLFTFAFMEAERSDLPMVIDVKCCSRKGRKSGRLFTMVFVSTFRAARGAFSNLVRYSA